LASHSHAPLYVDGSGSPDGSTGRYVHTDSTQASGIQTNTSGYTGDAGSDAAHNNCQPSRTVYMWRRTA
jgi:hypothetical protein